MGGGCWAAAGAVVALAVLLVFVVPLVGLRNKISAEKDVHLKLIAEDLNQVSGKLRAALGKNDLDALGKLRDGQEALNFQRNEVRHVRAWPWNTATLRGFASAFVLPIVIWLITRLLERFI